MTYFSDLKNYDVVYPVYSYLREQIPALSHNEWPNFALTFPSLAFYEFGRLRANPPSDARAFLRQEMFNSFS